VADLQHYPTFFMPILTHQLRRVTLLEGQSSRHSERTALFEGAMT
jgi:hypothetical protein